MKGKLKRYYQFLIGFMKNEGMVKIMNTKVHLNSAAQILRPNYAVGAQCLNSLVCGFAGG